MGGDLPEGAHGGSAPSPLSSAPSYGEYGGVLQALETQGFTRKCAQWTMLRDPLDLQTSHLHFLYGDLEYFWEKCLVNPTVHEAGPCAESSLKQAHLRYQKGSVRKRVDHHCL